jgi:hypothetical protein
MRFQVKTGPLPVKSGWTADFADTRGSIRIIKDEKIRDRKITGPAIAVLSRIGDHVPDCDFLVPNLLVLYPWRPKELWREANGILHGDFHFPLRLCAFA